jgi:hypothetical protein
MRDVGAKYSAQCDEVIKSSGSAIGGDRSGPASCRACRCCVCIVCVSMHGEWRAWKIERETDHEFGNLVQEIARLMCDCELFTFILHPKASGTNNEAERSLRDAAQDRRTGRTSKTLRVGQRRTILVSVLESLKLPLSEFTLASVQTEIQTWWQTGKSLFARFLKSAASIPRLNHDSTASSNPKARLNQMCRRCFTRK